MHLCSSNLCSSKRQGSGIPLPGTHPCRPALPPPGAPTPAAAAAAHVWLHRRRPGAARDRRLHPRLPRRLHPPGVLRPHPPGPDLRLPGAPVSLQSQLRHRLGAGRSRLPGAPVSPLLLTSPLSALHSRCPRRCRRAAPAASTTLPFRRQPAALGTAAAKPVALIQPPLCIRIAAMPLPSPPLSLLQPPQRPRRQARQPALPLSSNCVAQAAVERRLVISVQAAPQRRVQGKKLRTQTKTPQLNMPYPV